MPRKNVPACESEKSVFAERLTQAMKEHGENQTTLAEKITEKYVTIQRQTISLYMNGQSKPDTERLTAIAKVLDVSADWLLGLSDIQSQDGNVKQVRKYTGLSQVAIERLHQIATVGNAPNMVIAFLDSFLGGRYRTDFSNSAWRAAMTQAIYEMNIRNGHSLSGFHAVPESEQEQIQDSVIARHEQRENAINRQLLEQFQSGPQGRESIEVSAGDMSMLYGNIAHSCLEDALEDAIIDAVHSLGIYDD